MSGQRGVAHLPQSPVRLDELCDLGRVFLLSLETERKGPEATFELVAVEGREGRAFSVLRAIEVFGETFLAHGHNAGT